MSIYPSTVSSRRGEVDFLKISTAQAVIHEQVCFLVEQVELRSDMFQVGFGYAPRIPPRLREKPYFDDFRHNRDAGYRRCIKRRGVEKARRDRREARGIYRGDCGLRTLMR